MVRASAHSAASTYSRTMERGFWVIGVVPRSKTLTLHLEHRQERFLGNLDGADLLHTALTFLLFLEELALPSNVTSVTFRGDVLADRPQRFPRDHLAPESRLDGDLEHLTGDQLLELGA